MKLTRFAAVATATPAPVRGFVFRSETWNGGYEAPGGAQVAGAFNESWFLFSFADHVGGRIFDFAPGSGGNVLSKGDVGEVAAASQFWAAVDGAGSLAAFQAANEFLPAPPVTHQVGAAAPGQGQGGACMCAVPPWARPGRPPPTAPSVAGLLRDGAGGAGVAARRAAHVLRPFPLQQPRRLTQACARVAWGPSGLGGVLQAAGLAECRRVAAGIRRHGAPASTRLAAFPLRMPDGVRSLQGRQPGARLCVCGGHTHRHRAQPSRHPVRRAGCGGARRVLGCRAPGAIVVGRVVVSTPWGLICCRPRPLHP